jgi:outer membrane protein assembly factor BamB
MGSPAITGNLTFVAGCDSNLHVIDVKSGKPLAKIDLGGQAAATAAVVGDTLYVGTMTHQVHAVDLKKKELAWTYEPDDSQAFKASAAVTDKLVVVGSQDKHVHAIERATGKPLWSLPTKGRIDSSPVVAGSRAYVGSSDGHLYVIDLEKEGAQAQKLELGRGIIASPAIAGDCLVIGTTDGFLYCLGVALPKGASEEQPASEPIKEQPKKDQSVKQTRIAEQMERGRTYETLGYVLGGVGALLVIAVIPIGVVWSRRKRACQTGEKDKP